MNFAPVSKVEAISSLIPLGKSLTRLTSGVVSVFFLEGVETFLTVSSLSKLTRRIEVFEFGTRIVRKAPVDPCGLSIESLLPGCNLLFDLRL